MGIPRTGGTINDGNNICNKKLSLISINGTSIDGSLDDHDVRMGGSTSSDFVNGIGRMASHR